MYNEFWGRVAAVMIFLGFNLTFFPQFILGSRGMPRRYFDYSKLLAVHPDFTFINRLSSAGAFLTGTAMVIIVAYLFVSLRRGRPAPANPWGAATLEWQCSSPPPFDNFPEPPPVGDPYDFSRFQWDPLTATYVETGREPAPVGVPLTVEH
jgi:cytochrome c oxidase subunit 1